VNEEAFQVWLRATCFKPPTAEAEDLARAAWNHLQAEMNLLRVRCHKCQAYTQVQESGE